MYHYGRGSDWAFREWIRWFLQFDDDDEEEDGGANGLDAQHAAELT